MRTLQKVIASLLIIISLAACNMPGKPSAATPTINVGMVGTIAAMTLEALYSSTPAFTPTPAATKTPKVTATITPTVTPTFEQPLARFSGDTNCREGPGTEYDVTTVVRSGQKAEIIGKSEKGNYWIVKNPNKEGTCWVAGDYAETSGSLHVLPTMTAPPTPTPVPPKAPTWKSWNYACTFASGGSNITVDLMWSDNATNEDGYNIYRDDRSVTSFGPDITAYTDTAFVTQGQSITYVVEAFNNAGKARSSVVTLTCQ
jgi:hypothetical protein